MTTIVVPSAWRNETGGTTTLDLDVRTVAEAIAELRQRFSGLDRWLDNGSGSIPSYTHIFVGERDVRTLSGLATKVAGTDELQFIVAMAGG